MNMGNIGNELFTYSCTRNIYIYISTVSIYIIIKTCTKHDIGLEIFEKSPINEYNNLFSFTYYDTF